MFKVIFTAQMHYWPILSLLQSAYGRREEFYLFASVMEATMLDRRLSDKSLQVKYSNTASFTLFNLLILPLSVDYAPLFGLGSCPPFSWSWPSATRATPSTARSCPRSAARTRTPTRPRRPPCSWTRNSVSLAGFYCMPPTTLEKFTQSNERINH